MIKNPTISHTPTRKPTPILVVWLLKCLMLKTVIFQCLGNRWSKQIRLNAKDNTISFSILISRQMLPTKILWYTWMKATVNLYLSRYIRDSPILWRTFFEINNIIRNLLWHHTCGFFLSLFGCLTPMTMTQYVKTIY